MADLKDTLIGGFRILSEIKGASGSQGQIFKAVCEQPPFAGIEPGTVVALKAMAVHDEDGQAWAKLEKRTGELVRLSHPNVVKYYGCFSESGTFNDIHAIVQEFLDGETLKQRLLRFPSGLDADEALHVTEAALAGLEYTAANGIVHRDVKPGNIFLCSDGSVKLIDFEVAHQEGGTTTSASGNMVGSFDYMAPDFTNSVFRGDERSDVFSMGVVMHEAITGRTPYQRIEGGESQANFAFLSRWARLHMDGTNPIRISSRANRLLAHSEEVLEKALAPFPQDRYASFSEFHAGLKAIRYRDLRNGEMAYRILQIVGKGGFGEVYKARLKRTNQLVAIKHLLKAAYAERFYREAKIMAQLHDPCFVRFIDFFVVDHAGNREAFLVMDFLPGMPGCSLRDAIKRAGGAALPLRDTLLAFARFAHGLSVLHARGIFHRDIKPSNLYYPEGNPERAAIMDLGIARNIHGTATTGQVPGTLDYMPPEVVLTDNRGDSGMDIYALGLCLYEALSGKTAYPRLPQGAAALTAFFTRAKIKAMPDLSDPSVVENAPLHALLVQMTNPELSERIVDTKAVERRLTELAEAAGVGINLPELSAEDEEGPETTEPGTVTFTISSMEETNPNAPAAEERGTHGTVATRGTVATDTGGEEKRAALEQEVKRMRWKRFARGLAIAVAVTAVVCGAAWVFRAPLVKWVQVRAASAARPEAEHVAAAYADRGLEAGRRAEKDWLARWSPGRGRWVDVDAETFAFCTNRIRAAEMVLLDKEAEAAVADVVAAFADARETVQACEERAEAWRAQWTSRCSSAKVAACEQRIAAAKQLRSGRERRSSFDKFRAAGQQVAMSYQMSDKTLAYCDDRAKKWRMMCPDGFPDAEMEKLDAAIEKAKQDRVRAESTRAAEQELADVVKAYGTGVSAGDEQKDVWQKKWEKRIDSAAFDQMNAQIASARGERVEIERRLVVKGKQKECETGKSQIIASYRDDSADLKETDARYAEWIGKWKSDRDLPSDWLATRVAEVEKARKEREGRAKTDGEPVRPEPAGQSDDAEAKRLQLVAGKTNDVATVRAQLVDGYGNGTSDKAKLDREFSDWMLKWSADSDLPSGWFTTQREIVEKAKTAREKRDEEQKAKRAQRIFSKTNEIVSVRAKLMNDYADDSAKLPDVNGRFDRWVRDWENDADLKRVLPNWFDGQKSKVEGAKRAREERMLAREQANLVCDMYRKEGVAKGDGSRTFWIGNWTNKLNAEVFKELSDQIGQIRDERVKKDKVDDAARIEKERQARIAVKQSQAANDAKELVSAYGNRTIARTETDASWGNWRAKWETDADLAADWVAKRREEIEKARTERIARDVADQNRKDAYDAAVRVCKGYVSGVEAGEAERQLWDGKWKPVLGEADYAKIIAIIDKARETAQAKEEEARLRAEAERRKAEGERLEKECRALLEVDRNHVERWRNQLETVTRKVADGLSRGVFDEQRAAALRGEVEQRKRWVVGVVENQTQQTIMVRGKRVASGESEYLELHGGMPQGGLLVTSAGCKPLTVGTEVLDGAVVKIGAGTWKFEPIPKARVRVPPLQNGVTCLVDGVERTGEFELAAGNHTCVYRLKDHKDQKNTFSVNDGESSQLPEPAEWQPDDQFLNYLGQKLKEVEQCLEVNDGELCLRTYHEIWQKGYRLKEDDKANVEDAYEICKKDYKTKHDRAKRDPRFKEEDVRKWWEVVMTLYYDLTGKRD